ncbi:MAG TPA: oligosaccharide repeat unit polymerase [Bacteroidetes bacterium]|nr:oligosaccharide repeat unit polymerase [Bacteroidota bacterium]
MSSDKILGLNKTFSYLIVYYWILLYIPMPSYIMLTFPITLFVLYLLFYYIKDFSKLSTFSFIILFLFSSMFLSLLRLDISSLISITLFSLTIYFINIFRLRVNLEFLNKIFLFSILLSIPLFYSGLSNYGFLPGQGGFSHDEFLSGRVSLFPNVTSSIYFSFMIFYINLFYNKNLYIKLFFLLTSFYFIYFGISRTVLLGLVFILFFSWLFKLNPLRKNLLYQYILPIFLIVVPIIGIYFIQDIIIFLLSLDNAFISKYFFRGYTTVEGILDDIARVSIWQEHIRLFLDHPWGLSTSEIELYVNPNLQLSDAGGSESFLTRILIRYGFGALFLYFFLFELLTRATDKRNEYLYIFVYMFIFIGVTYGSFFVAYNMLFLVFMSSINLNR